MNNHKSILMTIAVLFGELALFVSLFTFFMDRVGSCDVLMRNQSMLIHALIFMMISYSGGVILYRRNTRDFQILLLELRNVAYFFIIYIILHELIDFPTLPFLVFLKFLGIFFAAASLYRLALRCFVKFYRSQKSHIHHVVLVGGTSNVLALHKEFCAVKSYGYEALGYFDFEPNPEFPEDCPYLGTPYDVILYLQNHREVHELYCCLSSSHEDFILQLVHYCLNNLVHFYSLPTLTNYMHHRMYFNVLGNVPYFSFFRDPLTKVENRMIKRTFDIVFSLTFLCTLFPIIFVIVAIVTKITMPGPIFFRQKRNGLNDKEFYCLKFRSMRVNADADKVQATKDDPRKTKWGNIMRKTNIDELPQFINVLMGDMSVVGPRPHMVLHTEKYSKLINMYMVRHFVKPGITGWSQVTGFRGETKDISQMEGRVRGDIWYIEHWSFWLDLYIIFKTVANAIIGDKEAY